MTQEAYARLERRAEVPLSTRVWRGQVGLVIVLILVALLVGVTAAVDLRRLQTPVGTAQRWSEATVFGDCTAYARLSVPEGGVRETRSAAEVCRDLRARVARTDVTRVQVRTRLVATQGRTAVVLVELARDAEREQTRLSLRRRGDGWAVVRDAQACRLGCA